jgi:Cu2+-containing amine oxidase
VLVPTSAADAGCCGRLLGDPPVAVREVRDRGVLWKDDAAVRRGRELVIWGTLDAANYNYIIEYAFRDDGSIAFRLGATARNLPGIETMAHMHGGLWRIDMDLAGAASDSASLVRHVESTGGSTASDPVAAFNGGIEGFADWNAAEFTQVRVTDRARLNGRGHNVSYDLVPLRTGSARHQESWTRHDFWMTRWSATELDFTDVATYASPPAQVTNGDLVIWHYAPVHHLPRDEDGRTVEGVWRGVALVMWAAFELRPRNLFDTTPLHP